MRIRLANPAAAMCFFATGSTGGRSKLMQSIWGCFLATSMQQSSCAADITQSAITREIEFVSQRFEVDAGKAGHPVEKALKLFRVGIQFIKDVFAPRAWFRFAVFRCAALPANHSS